MTSLPLIVAPVAFTQGVSCKIFTPGGSDSSCAGCPSCNSKPRDVSSGSVCPDAASRKARGKAPPSNVMVMAVLVTVMVVAMGPVKERLVLP